MHYHFYWWCISTRYLVALNRYQFMKEPLVCTLHPPIQASVDRCGNITSQRVAITGEITNFECHLGTFMITLKILDFTATHCHMIFVEVWTCRNFFVNLYHLMLKSFIPQYRKPWVLLCRQIMLTEVNSPIRWLRLDNWSVITNKKHNVSQFYYE